MKSIVLSCVFLAGCATECGPDWHALGVRDGRLNASAQLAIYQSRCSPGPDEERYRAGYSEGFQQRPIPSW